MRKLLVASIIGILLGVIIVPVADTHNIHNSTSKTRDNIQISGNGDTLYVGGEGPDNYTKIQSAINDASDGDTIFVCSGIYYENIFVGKAII